MLDERPLQANFTNLSRGNGWISKLGISINQLVFVMHLKQLPLDICFQVDKILVE